MADGGNTLGNKMPFLTWANKSWTNSLQRGIIGNGNALIPSGFQPFDVQSGKDGMAASNNGLLQDANDGGCLGQTIRISNKATKEQTTTEIPSHKTRFLFPVCHGQDILLAQDALIIWSIVNVLCKVRGSCSGMWVAVVIGNEQWVGMRSRYCSNVK